jgi:hypothetical protein
MTKKKITARINSSTPAKDQLSTGGKDTPPKRKRGNPNFGPGVGFQPNDPVTGFKDLRINRRGANIKPRSQRDFEKLLDMIFDEEVALAPIVNENGQVDGQRSVTALEALVKDLISSKDPRGKIELLARRFGKIPDKVNVTGNVKVIRARIGKVEKESDE